MGNNKSMSFQLITSFSTKFVVLLGSFVISIILARILGPEGKGIITAVFVVPNLIISLADLGIRQATAYYVGKKLYPLQDVFSSILVMWGITSSIAIFIVTFYFFTGASGIYGWSLLIIVLISIPLNLLNNYISGVLLGKERIGSINLKDLLSLVVNLISILILVWFLDLGVIGAAVTQVLIALFVSIYLLLILKKLVRFRFKVIESLPVLLMKKGISYALALFVINLNYKIDIIFIEKLMTPSDVGIYSIGVALSELVWQLPAVIGMVLFAKSANSKSDIVAVERTTRLLRISWIPLTVICFALWIFSPLFISVLYGEEFISGVSVIRWLVPGILIMVLFKILNADLAGRGYPLFALRVYLITLGLNIILNIFLIPKMGIDGAALASSLSYIVGGFSFGYVYKKKNSIKFSSLFILNIEDINMMKNLLKKLKK